MPCQNTPEHSYLRLFCGNAFPNCEELDSETKINFIPARQDNLRIKNAGHYPASIKSFRGSNERRIPNSVRSERMPHFVQHELLHYINFERVRTLTILDWHAGQCYKHIARLHVAFRLQ